MEKKTSNLIHIGRIFKTSAPQYLFLRKMGEKQFVWFIEEGRQEKQTELEGETAEEAFRLARKKWRYDSFRPLNCGFKFTLPERDEHGNNALWRDMSRSLQTFNGIYYDEELGFNCIVHQIPLDSRFLFERLQKEGRL